MLKKIINSCVLASLLALFSFYEAGDSFKNGQLKSARVKTAYQKKWPDLQALLHTKKVNPQNFDLYLRAFKQEGVLEVWAKNKQGLSYSLIKKIAICAKSGTLGPKRRQGDGQVPEGFYEITSFNPYSSYHLSLKLGYPNKSDAIKAKGNPGGDIMIHGYCVTIGCIPIENEAIEELYVLCTEARNRISVIHADVYPYRLNEPGHQELLKGIDPETLRIWESLKKACLHFEMHHSLPKISVSANGDYVLQTSKT